jgi:DNA-binding MarR family transcriptional regulator
MPETAPQRGYLIGALLALPTEVIRRRVAAAVVDGGFPDWRPSYAAVFMWLSANGDRISELAARVGVSKQAMGETITELERRGYVERMPDPSDGRATLIRRTDRGWAVNQVARRVVEEVQDEWARALGEEEFRELLDRLRHLVEMLNEPVTVAADPRMLGGTLAQRRSRSGRTSAPAARPQEVDNP